jgi:hypothetical protein
VNLVLLVYDLGTFGIAQLFVCLAKILCCMHMQDGVTGFHCGQLDPDGLLPADVDALAAAVNR